MEIVKDFEETKRDYTLRVARIYAQNLKEHDSNLHIEPPERHRFTRISSKATLALLKRKLDLEKNKYCDLKEIEGLKEVKKSASMRSIECLLNLHRSIYDANQTLGFPRTNAFQFHRWREKNAMVDENGQVWIKTGKPVEGWKL